MSSCYSNPSPTFQPAMRIVSAITNASEAAVTTTIDHDYLDGMIVRFYVPEEFGMTQISGLKGEITVTGTATFTVDIDTTKFDVFAAPSPTPTHYTCSQVIPVGEINSTLLAATRNVLPSGDF